jgi:putative molybdopterin biosynthesis protein
MKPLSRLNFSSQLKALSHPRRLEILRLLMAEPATLTRLGQAMGEHPAWVRHHLLKLEEAGLVELAGEKVIQGHVEKYYHACSRAYLIQELVLPQASERPLAVISGSHDLALELLAELVSPVLDVLMLPVGSLDGLIALRQGLCQVAGCHLYDSPTQEYNLPYLRHLFPDQPTTLIALAYRQQGLILPSGNPQGVSNLADLARPDLTFINRNRGSGTRLWLDEHLQRLGIPSEQVRGYGVEATTHTEVAQAVLQSRADLGLGIQASAQAAGLDFIPLFQERFDLALRQEQGDDPGVVRLFERLHSGSFQRRMGSLPGYELSCTGQQWQIGGTMCSP